MSEILTDDQKNALLNINIFLGDKDQYMYVLCGSAGTGKSYLTKKIIKMNNNMKICCIAPTHKAKGVLDNFVYPEHIDTYTIASILGKMKEHSYIGTKSFSTGSDKKLSLYNFFILDEVSMVSDHDLNIIKEYVKNNNKKLLCIGDPFQIPSPSQKIIKDTKNNICYKADSIAFSESTGISILKQIVRQQEDSYIIKVATLLRDNIMCDVKLPDMNVLSFTEMLDDFNISIIKYPYTCRCIAYTNKNVYDINHAIRNNMYKNNIFNTNNTNNSNNSNNNSNNIPLEFYKGEILMAYNTLGYPINYIVNGNDYIIESVIYTENCVIKQYNGLCGYYVKLVGVTQYLFFISINNIKNKSFMSELIRLAMIVNSRSSTKAHFIEYNRLRNEVVFREDLYKYKGKYYGGYEFKKEHPLLFIKSSDIIDHNKCIKKSNDLTIKKLKNNTDYWQIVLDRISDDKSISDNETFADRFMMIEKDIDYGYTITAHKSQGSTYDVVYVYDYDFDQIRDVYNVRNKCIENKQKEKNQLRYVSFTRSRYELKLFTCDFDKKIEEDISE